MAEAIKQASEIKTFSAFEKLRRSPWTRRLAIGSIFYLGLLLVWQLLFNATFWPDYILPSPSEVVTSIIDGFQYKFFLESILASLARLGIGYGISLGVGMVLGLLIGRFNLLKETLGTLVLGLQALPSICWLPLAILWFGLNDQAIIFVVIMGALFSITLGVESGVRNTPPIYLRAARNMGARGISLYTQVILPAALPSIINGLKQGWSFSWRSLMAGELIYNTPSFGNLLQDGTNLLDSAQVVAVMLLIIIVGILIDAALFRPLEKLTRQRWGLEVE